MSHSLSVVGLLCFKTHLVTSLKPTALPASSACFQVRISGRPLPKLISSMMRTCSAGTGRGEERTWVKRGCGGMKVLAAIRQADASSGLGFGHTLVARTLLVVDVDIEELKAEGLATAVAQV